MTEIRKKIIGRIQSLENLPALGGTVSQIQQCFYSGNDSKVDVCEIVRLVEKDIGLTAKILKIANSVYFGGRYGEIGSIQQAVTRLGFDVVARLCITVGTMRLFPNPSCLIDLKEFWRHSTSVAMVTRIIGEKAKRLNGLRIENAYVAGLLHDIGILILDLYFPEIYQKIRETARHYSVPMHRLERELLEIDHGEIGGLVLEAWKLPADIVHAASLHHRPDQATPDFLALTQLVHVADFACSALCALEPGGTLPDGCSLGAWHDLDIDINRIRDIVDETEDEILRSNVFVDLGI